MKKGLVRKSLVAGIVALFVVMSVLPAVNAAVCKKAQMSLTVNIEKPKKGYLYINDVEIGKTLTGATRIVGSITIKASASGGEGGIDKVEFYITGVPDPRFTDYEWPYEWYWDDTAVGTHEIKVTAYDGVGHVASKSLDVIVIMNVAIGEVEAIMAEAMMAEAVASGDIDVELASSLILNSYNLAADTSTNSK